jgi:hypothetical protein
MKSVACCGINRAYIITNNMTVICPAQIIISANDGGSLAAFNSVVLSAQYSVGIVIIITKGALVYTNECRIFAHTIYYTLVTEYLPVVLGVWR